MLLPLSKSTIAGNVILELLATIAVALRLVARRNRKLELKADDYVIIFALVCFVPNVCLTVRLTLAIGLSHGMLHLWHLRRRYESICHSSPVAIGPAVFGT